MVLQVQILICPLPPPPKKNRKAGKEDTLEMSVLVSNKSSMTVLGFGGAEADHNVWFYSSQMKMDKGNLYGKHHGQLVRVLLVELS